MRTKPTTRQLLWAPVLSASTVLIVATSAAETPRPDTSNWKCESCPFARGYTSEYSLGGTYVSDDAARFGNATGYDEQGGYVYADGTGTFTAQGGYQMQWDLVDLGTDARAVTLSGGAPGVYEYRLGYSELPYRRFDDTYTVFRDGGSGRLFLPGDGTLVQQNIETDRTNYEVGGEYRGLDNLSFSADYRRSEREGWGQSAISFFTNGAQFPAPIDDSTDTIDVAAAYTRENWFVQLGWTGSFYDNSNVSWTVDNAFFTGTGPTQGQLAQSPDNEAQVFTLSGAYNLPYRTVISASASIGEMTQNETLLPYSIDPALSGALPRESFDGQVDTTHYDLRVVSQPWSMLRLRAYYRYDERDNQSSVDLWTRTITDLFTTSGGEENRPYSFERARIGGAATARFDFFDWLSAFEFEAGYEYVDLEHELQEAEGLEEETSYGQVRWQISPASDLRVRGGISRRDLDEYDLTLAAANGQNPRMRKYNLAYRFRDFWDIRLTTAASESVTLGAQVYYASTDYTESELGLRKNDDRRIGVDASWAASESTSVYLQGAFEEIDLRTVNSEAFGPADWRSEHADMYRSFGGGLNIRDLLSDRLALRFDATYAKGNSNINVTSRFSGEGDWPKIKNELIRLTFDADYSVTEALDVRLRLQYEDFAAEDWQLEGVEPGSIPQVITLGQNPYNYNVYLVTLAVRYSFGRAAPGGDAQEQTGQ